MHIASRLLRVSSIVSRSKQWLTCSGVKCSSSLAPKMAPKLADKILSTHNIIKSESDKNEYRGLVLKNGLKVLVVSDPTTDKSAGSLNVQAGYLSDPKNIPGLAHFCEHMLFLGTKKFPQENAYSSFLSNHGGMCNAYTSLDHTCYFFDIPPNSFKGATDIFSQFFLEPLFDPSCTSRELNAVDSEHEKNIKQDMWRMWRLESVTGNMEHDFAKFGTGNRTTLETIPAKDGVDVREALLDFHGKYYSSNIMSVCLLGKENLDDLSDMAAEMFADVANKNVKAPSWPDHPFTEKELRIQAKVVPVKDLRQMNLAFPVPDMREHYKANPGHYLSHLIGHEGEGSLLSFLKDKGWANSLSGGVRAGGRGFSFFSVSMNLSPEGLKHTDDIAAAFFQYLKMLRKEGPQKWIFEELKNLGMMNFRFKSKERPINYVPSLTEAMHEYAWNDVLSAPYLIEEYKPELIAQLMDCLTPEKVRIALVAKDFEGQTDRIEQYYGTKYSTETISEKLIDSWNMIELNDALHLPTPNIFIPTNFNLCPEDSKFTKEPSLIMNDPSARVWFMQDKEYELPHNMATFELRTPLAYQDPLSACLTNLSLLCFADANNEHFYPAGLAGLAYSLENNVNGILLKVNGYNEKQQAMLEKVCERLVEFTIDPKRFEILKEAYVRKLKNFAAEQPYQHALYYSNMVLAEKMWTQEQVLAVVDQCTVEVCQQFLPSLLKKVHVESLVHGNMDASQATRMAEAVQRILNLSSLSFEETSNLREYSLKDGSSYAHNRVNEVHPTNSVMAFYQVGCLDTKDLRPSAVNDLFCQIFEEPCYDVLRTKEQLGYIVSGGKRRSLGTHGVRVIVQSEKSPSFVSERIDDFINVYMKKYLEELSVEEFENHKQALIALKLEKPKKLAEQNKIMWREINSRTYLFNREQLEAGEIAKLTKDDVIAFYKSYIAQDGEKKKTLLVNIESKTNPGEKGKGSKVTYDITDVDTFRKDHVLFESPKPVSSL